MKILVNSLHYGRMKSQRTPLLSHRLPSEHGPFDIIGDVHGCCDELERLLEQLGYHTRTLKNGSECVYCHPENRKVIFLGDIVDRGPRILDALRLVMTMVNTGAALCVIGNHDDKFLRKLKGRNVQIKHGLETTLQEMAALPPDVQKKLAQKMESFLASLINYYILDEGRLIVAHAGLKEALHGKIGDQVRAFTLYGETTGKQDEYGLPVRQDEYGLPVRVDWAADYTGKPMVVYGHTPVPEACWVNNTLNIDTGCIFGGKLTALRYPEKTLVSVQAAKVYYQSAPFPYP